MTDINKSMFFAANPQTVWAFLTDKDKLGLWFYPAEADLAEGEDYVLVQIADDGQATKQCWGTVTKMEAPTRLEYTFTIKPLEGNMTTLVWTLEEIYGGTRLTLQHSGIDTVTSETAMGMLFALDAGWDRHLAKLRSAAAA